jgi:hypothetical protein
MHWIIILLSSALIVSAQSSSVEVTAKGVTYVDVGLIKEYPRSVLISHAAGRSFLNKADLSPDDAQTLGVAIVNQAPEASTAATPSSPSGGTSKNDQFTTQSAEAIRGASMQEVDAALESLEKRIAEQKGALKVLIPRTAHVTDLYELWRDYLYGFLDAEIDGMARAQGDVLAKEGHLYGSDYDSDKTKELFKKCGQKMDAVVTEANLWIARRNEFAEAQAQSAGAAPDEFSEMFKPVRYSMPSIEDRRENVKNGYLPLTGMELDRFRSGRPLSSMAGDSEKKAWIMAEVMVGRRPASDIPEEYGGIPKGNSRRAVAERRKWERDKAYRAAVSAGPGAEAQFMQSEKTQQHLRNIEMQQMQLRGQLDMLQWQQQTRSMFGW